MGGWGGVSLNIIKFVGGEGSRQMKIVCGLRGWLVVFAVCNVCYYSSYCNVGVLMNSNCGGGLNKQMFRPFQLLMNTNTSVYYIFNQMSIECVLTNHVCCKVIEEFNEQYYFFFHQWVKNISFAKISVK